MSWFVVCRVGDPVADLAFQSGGGAWGSVQHPLPVAFGRAEPVVFLGRALELGVGFFDAIIGGTLFSCCPSKIVGLEFKSFVSVISCMKTGWRTHASVVESSISHATKKACPEL